MVEVVGTAQIPELVAYLARRGVALHAVVPMEPTLEEFYVALHDRSGDAGSVEGPIAGEVIAASLPAEGNLGRWPTDPVAAP